MVEQKFRWFVFGRYQAGIRVKPSVELTFLNRDLAFEGLLNGIDQLGATAAGEVMIRRSHSAHGQNRIRIEVRSKGGPQAHTMKKRTQSDELFERASKVVPGGILRTCLACRRFAQAFSSFLRPCPRGPVRGRGWKRVARFYVRIRSDSSRLQSS